jgi:hypothetical protein
MARYCAHRHVQSSRPRPRSLRLRPFFVAAIADGIASSRHHLDSHDRDVRSPGHSRHPAARAGLPFLTHNGSRSTGGAVAVTSQNIGVAKLGRKYNRARWARLFNVRCSPDTRRFELSVGTVRCDTRRSIARDATDHPIATGVFCIVKGLIGCLHQVGNVVHRCY